MFLEEAYIYSTLLIYPDTLTAKIMVWTGNHEDGVSTAEDQLKHAKSLLPDQMVDDCQKIAECCHQPLENHAQDRHQQPHPTLTPAIQGKNLVEAVRGSTEYDTAELYVMEEINYDYELDDTQIRLAQEIMGLTILKNGSEEPSGSVELPDRIESLVESLGAGD